MLGLSYAPPLISDVMWMFWTFCTLLRIGQFMYPELSRLIHAYCLIFSDITLHIPSGLSLISR